MATKLLGVEDASVRSDQRLEKENKTWVFNKTWERSYYVLAALDDTDDTVANTVGIPAAGQTINGASCIGVQPEDLGRVRNPTTGAPSVLWRVRAQFDSKMNPSDLEEDPTDIRPKRRIYTEKVDELVETDWDGRPLETSAGELISTEFPFPDIIMEIERYEDYPPNLLNIYNYIYHSNDAEFYGAPIGSAYMDDIQVDEAYLNNQLYLKTKYVIRFRIRDAEGGGFRQDLFHFFQILNQGYLYRKEVGGKAETYLVNGQPVKINLDEDGLKLPADALPEDMTYLADVVRSPYADFDALNLEY